MDTNDRLIDLITIKLSGSLTREESSELEQLLMKPGNREVMADLESKWEGAGRYRPRPTSDASDSWMKLQQAIEARGKIRPPFSKALFLRAAAVLAIALGIGYLSLNLDNKPIAYRTGIGQTIEVSLPDGSTIWLNESTELSYNEGFNVDQRDVTFSGEAHFDIQRNESVPFVIKSEHSAIRVLGTTFTVSAYPEGGFVEVNVTTGKVALQAAKSGREIILEKGMQGRYTLSNNSLVGSSELNVNHDSWRSGTLLFDDKPLSEVISDLERHYKTKITLRKAALSTCKFSGSFQDALLDDIIEVIAVTVSATVTMDANGYVMAGEGCLNN